LVSILGVQGGRGRQGSLRGEKGEKKSEIERGLILKERKEREKETTTCISI
jgi:hypothetical protein